MSSTFLFVAFIIYCIAMIGFVIGITGQKSVRVTDPETMAGVGARLALA